MSGESLDLLKVFLNILPPLTNSKEQEELNTVAIAGERRGKIKEECRRRLAPWVFGGSTAVNVTFVFHNVHKRNTHVVWIHNTLYNTLSF